MSFSFPDVLRGERVAAQARCSTRLHR